MSNPNFKVMSDEDRLKSAQVKEEKKQWARTKKSNIIYGFGINDADYNVYPIVNGKITMCKFYERFKNMMQRGYSKTLNTGASVCAEWVSFSKFKSWMEIQIWQGLELDKDILVKGNKEYGPEFCAFVPKRLNTLLGTVKASRGEYPLGVYYQNKNKQAVSELNHPYRARVSTTSEEGKIKTLNIGYYKTALEAHKAWQWAKALEIEKAVTWYATQDCFRTDVAAALLSRVWELRLALSLNRETKTL